MAIPTPVNGQITDAITQSNITSIASAPGTAVAVLVQTMAQSLAMAAQNAVTAQQQMNLISEAATARGVSLIYGGEKA